MIYQIEKGKWKKLITDAIMSTHKKISDKISNKVNGDVMKIMENKEVVKRMFVYGRNSWTVKKHKFCLLNSAKS